MIDGVTPKKVRYFHGGDRGLHVNDYILPQSETGVKGMSHPLCRKDRAYVTPHIDHARFFASGAREPVVYEVVPEGEIEADPDANKSGISFACPKARIIAIHKVPGKVIKKNRKIMQRAGR
ncbi:hypothetical protein [Bradyrhizobium sp. th.b2]|uniref:hypothetical protein n=1 Tax=Bradyrhizobium sp. th-b2 TaxID=172088 RepID=UPI000400069E|nr:hypothetical protein [Bradyrhizobium sp. th.b2]